MNPFNAGSQFFIVGGFLNPDLSEEKPVTDFIGIQKPDLSGLHKENRRTPAL
ncbi:hypothetical protein J7L68_02905 [bacterium]|nr:hypothetical protein [bacterium]